MKVLITSTGTTLDSPVDPRFGRAQSFILVDLDSGESTVADNAQNLNASQGAGIQAARIAAQLKADAVITGNVGPKAFTTLAAANIAIYVGATGTVREAVARLKAGELQRADEANVEGHWT